MELRNRFLRNKDLIDQKSLDEVMIIGLGGVGSALVTNLSIMGFDRIIGYDDDVLEDHNLSSTVYPVNEVGNSKARAAEYQALAYGCPTPVMFEKRWTPSSNLSSKMIVCPDNNEVRLQAYQAWWDNTDEGFFIDLRMDALQMEIVAKTKPDGIGHKGPDTEYLDYWKSSDQIEDAPCTMKHTIFTSSILSGFGIDQVFNLLGKRPYYRYIWIGLTPLIISKERLISGY
jgi:hypothetical protein|tara:strand:+ start:2312 stop:2998 length:687 start_codon:yes stop_codon:yes gene_type:complete